MLSPVPQPTGIPARSPSAAAAAGRDLPGASRGREHGGQQRRVELDARQPEHVRRVGPVDRVDHQPVPEASPRSVRAAPAEALGEVVVRQPHGAPPRRRSGSVRRSHAHSATVNEATGTTPVALGPPRRAARLDQRGGVRGAARVVPQQRRAQRAAGARRARPARAAGRRPRSRATSAARPVARSASRSAVHHASGSVSRAPPAPSTVVRRAARRHDRARRPRRR